MTWIDSRPGRSPRSLAAPGVLAAIGVASGLTQAASTTPSTSTTTTPTTTAKPKPKATATTRKVSCRVALVATQPPIDSADDFGTLACSAPFGNGVQHDTATITRTARTEGSLNGGVKLFFDTGTLRGTYKTSFTVANKTVTYTGTVKVSSGTSGFQGVTGSGTMTGTSTDAVHSSITDKLTLKIPPTKR